jgi:hypothetical protein
VSIGPLIFTTTINNKIMTSPTSNTGPTDRADLSTARTATAGPKPNSAGKAPGKLGPSPQEKKASRPTHPTVFYLAVTILSSTNITLAGVAQSVERVALINSKEINLKVVGSSPTFGYSYHTSSSEQLSFCSFDVGFGWEVWWGWCVVFWGGCGVDVGCFGSTTASESDNEARGPIDLHPSSIHAIIGRSTCYVDSPSKSPAS